MDDARLPIVTQDFCMKIEEFEQACRSNPLMGALERLPSQSNGAATGLPEAIRRALRLTIECNAACGE